jgi:hypothetical protein
VDLEIAATRQLFYAVLYYMSVTPAKIQALLETELSALTDQRVISHVRRLLVEPTAVMRDWDYGGPGERYPCWAVLNHNDSNTGIAYCESGFGPKCPWGLVSLSGTQHMSIGMDSAWHECFLDAYFESMAASELPIWRVFTQEDNTYPGIALTPEADWDSTWKEIYRLRAAHPKTQYNCSQNIFAHRSQE